MNRLVLVSLLLVAFGLVSADGDALEEGKRLVETNASCDELTGHQLEEIGEYYMEQMHPGTSHARMHEIMGFEEGDPAEEEFHVNLAKAMYCGTNESGGMMGGGMMGGMMQRMMGWNTPAMQNGQRMMQYYTAPSVFGWNIFDLLTLVLLIGLVILAYMHIWRKIKEGKGR